MLLVHQKHLQRSNSINRNQNKNPAGSNLTLRKYKSKSLEITSLLFDVFLLKLNYLF